ncbi:hypothetical protein NPIL_198751 [Nephila pilipes]|uniref:Uncharacterized protein n=1 Tax=Nephila pilipes TaxID=299642 RepID=A0A8X6UW50_NEPPI|nr:hypothetical protein NPIL_198751 [Nephila pilipes]
MFKSSRKIACAESLFTPTSSAISRTVKRRSAITKFRILSTLSALRAVWGLPQRCSLSADVRLSLNRLNHFLICVTPTPAESYELFGFKNHQAFDRI